MLEMSTFNGLVGNGMERALASEIQSVFPPKAKRGMKTVYTEKSYRHIFIDAIRVVHVWLVRVSRWMAHIHTRVDDETTLSEKIQ